MLYGCADSHKFKRAEDIDEKYTGISTTAIAAEESISLAAMGVYRDKYGDIVKIDSVPPNVTHDSNPPPLLMNKDTSSLTQEEQLLANAIIQGAVNLGLATPNIPSPNIEISLFSGPVINSTVQLNTGAAARLSGGSTNQESFLSIAREGLKKIGTPVKTDLEIISNTGYSIFRNVAFPLAGAYVLKEAFKAAGDNIHVADSNNPDNSTHDIDNSVSSPSATE